ncbi:hypothetical protein EI94DRAFT_1752563 [Lactarius quietus]|nr:hypothetical protein EI94DRAFT_1752563 [Lactarius quietus]
MFSPKPSAVCLLDLLPRPCPTTHYQCGFLLILVSVIPCRTRWKPDSLNEFHYLLTQTREDRPTVNCLQLESPAFCSGRHLFFPPLLTIVCTPPRPWEILTVPTLPDSVSNQESATPRPVESKLSCLPEYRAPQPPRVALEDTNIEIWLSTAGGGGDVEVSAISS